MSKYLEPTPWDSRNFPLATYQLTEYNEDALRESADVEGHFTVKVDRSQIRHYFINMVFTMQIR